MTVLAFWMLLQLPPPVERDPRVAQLQEWIAAAQAHRPGTADEPLFGVRAWTAAQLGTVRRDLRSVGFMIRDPNVRVFFADPDPDRPARARQPIPYTPNQLEGLRRLARERGRRRDLNQIVKRGAMLHTDIAMFAPPAGAPSTRRPTAALDRATLFMDDGRQLRVEDSVGHWEMARSLLDMLTPNPERDDKPQPEKDPEVRLWYRATMTYMQSNGKLELPHFNRAVELFPADPQILFLAGVLHETLAGPRVQAAVRSANLPPGTTFAVASEGRELRRAEDLLRRAVEADPALAEARIHLGRVLGLLERPKEAAAELRLALSTATDPLLEYYGRLFLGREAAALGDVEQARAAFLRAADLYPSAQSPRLGLSQLAAERGDRSAAVAALEHVSSGRAGSSDRDDPWWTYILAAGRAAEALLSELYNAFPVEQTP